MVSAQQNPVFLSARPARDATTSDVSSLKTGAAFLSVTLDITVPVLARSTSSLSCRCMGLFYAVMLLFGGA